MTTTIAKLFAIASLASPAAGWAHSTAGAVHGHDGAAWGSFAVATALCWGAYRIGQRLSAQHRAASRRIDSRCSSDTRR